MKIPMHILPMAPWVCHRHAMNGGRERSLVLEAVSQWSGRTCWRFVRRLILHLTGHVPGQYHGGQTGAAQEIRQSNARPETISRERMQPATGRDQGQQNTVNDGQLNNIAIGRGVVGIAQGDLPLIKQLIRCLGNQTNGLS